MAELRVRNLVKTFGEVRAVDDVSFTVREGEFLTLLGPSGCGKSTTLGAVAGLDRPDSGVIELGDQVFFDSTKERFVPTESRGIGLVFQSYALWPHMTVSENLEFPLKLRKIPRSQRERQVAEVLALVEMSDYGKRYPHALSGGQQQRVALARTLVYRPNLLLLDEPLSNLDAKLRERARTWLRQLQHQVAVTTVYVTHDQSEALALSDRIAVMNSGKIVQLADPQTIYEQPTDPFVADFIGSSNFFEGEALESGSGSVSVGLTDLPPLSATTPHTVTKGSPVTVSVRPERIEIADRADDPRFRDGTIWPVSISERLYLGARHQMLVTAGQHSFRVETDRMVSGDGGFVHIPPDACVVFPTRRGIPA